MRGIRGLERPALQWMLVGCSLVLVVAVGVLAWSVRSAGASIRQLHAQRLEASADRQRIEASLAREQASREALALELARRGTLSASPAAPTLTLTPGRLRGAQPPAATVETIAPSQVVELRLVLPAKPVDSGATYTIRARDWSSGRTLWLRAGLTAVREGPRAWVPAHVAGDALRAGAYEILLTRGEPEAAVEVATYEVTIK
jgi:hypothetical protein